MRREILSGTLYPRVPALPSRQDVASTQPQNARLRMVSAMTAEYRRDLLVDASRCTGCLDCVKACTQAVAPQHTRVPPVPRIAVQEVDGVFVPLVCHNCEEAPCMVSCLSGCRVRDASGWVTTDYSRCVGCWMCVMACPFGAIVPSYPEKLARKCDGCTHLEIMPCVAACPTGALIQGGTETLSLLARRGSAERIARDRLGHPAVTDHGA